MSLTFFMSPPERLGRDSPSRSAVNARPSKAVLWFRTLVLGGLAGVFLCLAVALMVLGTQVWTVNWLGGAALWLSALLSQGIFVGLVVSLRHDVS